MATLQAKRIKEALKKVKRVGRIEEGVSIAGCEVFLQNLSPDEFEAALKEIEGLEDVAYAHAYQLEQVSRAIVEIDGQDLREADFIEDEVPVGQYVLELVLPNKATAESVAAKLREQKLHVTVTQQEEGGTKTVKLERHQWLKENVLRTWSREALTVAWRKFTEVLIKADEVAKKGVEFLVPDETAEDKYRRLLNDLRETEDELPDEMVNRILDDAGFMKKSRREELDAVDARLTAMREPAGGDGESGPASAPAEAVVAQVRVPPPPAPNPGPPATPAEPPTAVQQAMAARQRMNAEGADIPIPSPPNQKVPVSAAPKVQVPPQIRRAATQNTQGVHGVSPEGGINPRRQNRASEIAALEAQLDPSIAEEGGIQVQLPAAGEVAELSQKTQGVDEQGLRSIVDRPPAAGVNTKFKPRY